MDVKKVFWRPLAMVAEGNNGGSDPFERVTILPARALNNAPLITKAHKMKP